MSFSYVKTNWVNETSPAINSTNLLNLENAMVRISGSGASSGVEAQYVTTPDNTKLQPATGSTKLWTDANDGHLSGMDADTLDTKQLIVFTYQYDAARTYALNDTCIYNGLAYRSLQAANTGNTPATATTYWAFTMPALSGDVVTTNVGTTNVATIQVGVVTNAKLATMATNSIKGRVTSGTGAVEDLSADNVKVILRTGTDTNTVTNFRADTAVTATNLAAGTSGAIPYQSVAGSTSMLPIGANGYVLTSSGSAPTWTSASLIPVGVASNISGGAAGQVVYQSGSGSTNFTATGTAGQVLQSNGSSGPTWLNQSSLVAGDITGGAAGQLLYQSGSGATDYVAAGTAGYLLKANGTSAPSWVASITTSYISDLATASTGITKVGTITTGTWSGSFGAVSGANLTTLNASNISSGTLNNSRLPSAISVTTLTASGTVSGATVSASTHLIAPTSTPGSLSNGEIWIA